MARWEHISNIWAGRGVGSVLGVCGRTGVACWRSENLVKTHHTNRCERFKRKGNQTKQISPSLKLDVESVFLCSSHSVIHSLAKHKLALRHHLNMEGYRKTRLQTRPMTKCGHTDQFQTQMKHKDHVCQVRMTLHPLSNEKIHRTQPPSKSAFILRYNMMPLSVKNDTN